ncbi:MAG: hypothetical protein KH120_04635 [Eubacterium sp.]|nr:hypothetical protein [Eubacterium sp.]
MHREIKEINRCIKKYAHQTVKAQKLNTTDNEHYRLRIRTLRYLMMLKILLVEMDADQIGELMLEADRKLNITT